MATIRRLARQATSGSNSGTLLVTARPISTSVPFPSQSHTTVEQPQSKQRASSWAALSRAGHSLFATSPSSTPSLRPAEPHHPSLVLSGPAAELVEELKRPNPDPIRCWTIFNLLDIKGESHSLPVLTLHFLLRAIIVTPPDRSLLSVDSATDQARQYSMKAELIKLRIIQGGGRITQSDFHAQMLQFYLFKYAPGSCKIWDEMVEAGISPPQKVCVNAFETLVDWIGMHEAAGGMSLGRVAARPLVQKALSMMEDLKGDKRKMDQVLGYFFKVALKATDKEVFGMGMREVYGFDMALPGAEVYSKPEVKARRRVLGEEEVTWILEILAETKDLSGMIAVFEVIDNPPPSSSDNASEVDPNFFAPSFAAETPSHLPSSTETSLPLQPPPPQTPHLIGTKAFELMIQTASRLGRGAIARQYFNQLYWRWQLTSDQRLAEIEKAVGMVQVKKTSVAASSEVAPVEGMVQSEAPEGLSYFPLF